MANTVKTIIKVFIPLLLGVVLVWYSLSQISIEELLQYCKKADYAWVGAGVFLGFLSHLSRAYRWRFMIAPMGYNMRFANSFMAVMAAYLINYTIPRAGEISRATILSNYEGVPFEKGFGTIVAERVADMLVMLSIICVTLLLEFDYIYAFLSERFNPVKIALALLVLVVLFFSGLAFINRSQHKFAIKFRGFLKGLIEGVTSIFKMKKKWAFIFHTLFIWTMYVMMFYVTTFALVETSGIPFAAILIGFIAATFSIAATNGGVGSYPEAIVLAFLLFNLPEDPSRAFGWIIWASQTLLIIILGGLSLIYLPIYNRRK
ncbi:MAG: flippase-like domain-containing protein [Flavobacteriaceae bacterium]|nr:flippase-like domain-containing protein [Flavobacteriaceae bacterium]